MSTRLKRIMAIVLTIVCCFILASCSNDNEGNVFNEESSSYEGGDNNDLAAYEGEGYYDLTALEAERILDFVNGKAWVQDNTEYTRQVYCINTQGKKLFQLDGNYSYASPFYDGVAFVVKTDLDGHHWEKILSSEGKELFVTYNDDVIANQSLDDVTDHILAYGDGKFVVLRHEADIDNNDWTLGTIDKNGKTIDEFYSYSESGSERTIIDEDFIPKWGSTLLRQSYSSLYYHGDTVIPEYLGDGYFLLYDNGSSVSATPYVYNPSKGTLFKVNNSDNVFIRGEVSKGYLSSMYRTGKGEVNSWYKIDLESGNMIYPSYLPKGTSSDYIPFESSFQDIFSNDTDTGYSQVDLGMKDGLIFYDHGFYDIDGNEVVHVKGYENQVIHCSPYTDDYALMLIDGADGNQYVTLVNKNGDIQFDPMKTDFICNQIDDGYFVSSYNGKTSIYDCNGKMVSDLNCDKPNRCYVSEGFVRVVKGSYDRLYRIPT